MGDGLNSCRLIVCGRGWKPERRWQNRFGVMSGPPTFREAWESAAPVWDTVSDVFPGGWLGGGMGVGGSLVCVVDGGVTGADWDAMGGGLRALINESKETVDEARANARVATRDAMAHRERIRRWNATQRASCERVVYRDKECSTSNVCRASTDPADGEHLLLFSPSARDTL